MKTFIDSKRLPFEFDYNQFGSNEITFQCYECKKTLEVDLTEQANAFVLFTDEIQNLSQKEIIQNTGRLFNLSKSENEFHIAYSINYNEVDYGTGIIYQCNCQNCNTKHFICFGYSGEFLRERVRGIVFNIISVPPVRLSFSE